MQNINNSSNNLRKTKQQLTTKGYKKSAAEFKYYKNEKSFLKLCKINVVTQ